MVSLSNHEPVGGSSFDKLRTSGLQKRREHGTKWPSGYYGGADVAGVRFATVTVICDGYCFE